MVETIKGLKKGSYIVIDGVVCKVDSVSVTKSGKHGASKGRVDAIGLFDGRRRSIVKPADSHIVTPMILKKKAQVLAVVSNRAQLMDMEDYNTFELEIPEVMEGKLNSGDEVNYFDVQGVKTLKAVKG